MAARKRKKSPSARKLPWKKIVTPRPRGLDRAAETAVRDVLKQYSLTRSGPDKDGFLQVEGKRPGATYKVRIDPAWRLPPTCTCPDAKRVKDGKGATFCKHTIAALLSDEEHRHQLIDLLL